MGTINCFITIIVKNILFCVNYPFNKKHLPFLVFALFCPTPVLYYTVVTVCMFSSIQLLDN